MLRKIYALPPGFIFLSFAVTSVQSRDRWLRLLVNLRGNRCRNLGWGRHGGLSIKYVEATPSKQLPNLFMTTPLPTYSATNSGCVSVTGDQLPDYNDTEGAPSYTPSNALNAKLPPTFRVGQKYTQPLLQPSDLQSHLILLGAFHRLREEVRTQKGQTDFKLEPDEMWAVFLQRAVHRFKSWVTRVIDVADDDNSNTAMPETRRLTADECPPTDVMMIWHTYMLSPRIYQEDCLRMHPGLRRIGSFPLLQMCSTIDAETLLPRPPALSRAFAFQSFTGESFDPPTRTVFEDTVTIYCPSCLKGIGVPWVSHAGNGYAQRGFSTLCDVDGGCNMEFDHETLGVRKFYQDMEKCMLNPDTQFLANTLVDYKRGIPIPSLAKSLTGLVLKISPESRFNAQRPEVLGDQLGWKMADVEKICRAGYQSDRNRPDVPTPKALNIILAPYRYPESFSIDLTSAVLRQMSFIEKMVYLGWTEEGRFEEDPDTLARCVARYHAFLDLMITTPGRFVVPTLDIDLAWHTHQLLCTSYRKLFNLMQMIPDHDDKVTQEAISTAYDQTAKAWEARFSVPYSVCGCPPPVKSNPNSAIMSALVRKGKGKATPITVNNPRPDLVSVDDTSADDTHPSDDNSVALINPPKENAAQAQLRRRELVRRGKELTRSKEGDFPAVQGKRAVDHTYAFLSPVAYGAKNPFGSYGHGDCAAYSGTGVKGEFAAGECVRGMGDNGMCGALFTHLRSGLAESVDQGILMSGDRELILKHGQAMDYGEQGVPFTTIGGGLLFTLHDFPIEYTKDNSQNLPCLKGGLNDIAMLLGNACYRLKIFELLCLFMAVPWCMVFAATAWRPLYLPTLPLIHPTLHGPGSEAPPGYNDDNTTAYMPFTALNQKLGSTVTFHIDKTVVQPLVLPSDLQAHLIILGAFRRLREDVRTQKGKSDFSLKPDEMWSVFLERAVHRFACWATWINALLLDDSNDNWVEPRVPLRLDADHCPPLDVMMVWHMYMLCPRIYREDCLRIHHGLKMLGSFPLVHMSSAVDQETLLPHSPPKSQAAAFLPGAGELFDPPIRTAVSDWISKECPN
ncbi:hypothetical protein FRB94_005805 [Tulasnella sp. JGI-2019a]|nr:hypothetical protein FRB94_005805 [Tulasnella sp. JGI-2019a]